MADIPAALSWVPDEPSCVEARGMLLTGRGSIVFARGRTLVVYAPGDRLASIVGAFKWADVAATLDDLPRDVEVVAREEDARGAGRVPDAWQAEPATVQTEAAFVPPRANAILVRPITIADRDLIRHVPDELRDEIEHVLTCSTVVAAFDRELPVSFCYAGWETERWWDVSIDTLARWRSRGYATAAAGTLIALMRRRGKRAVWAALDSNVPSLRVAAALGFQPTGKLYVLAKKAGAEPGPRP